MALLPTNCTSLSSSTPPQIAFVALLGAVTLEVALVARYWTWLFGVLTVLSYVLVYPYMVIFPLAGAAGEGPVLGALRCCLLPGPAVPGPALVVHRLFAFDVFDGQPPSLPALLQSLEWAFTTQPTSASATRCWHPPPSGWSSW